MANSSATRSRRQPAVEGRAGQEAGAERFAWVAERFAWVAERFAWVHGDPVVPRSGHSGASRGTGDRGLDVHLVTVTDRGALDRGSWGA